MHLETGEVVAIKQIPRSMIQPTRLQAEVDLLRMAGQHKNVVNFRDLFSDDKEYYIVMGQFAYVFVVVVVVVLPCLVACSLSHDILCTVSGKKKARAIKVLLCCPPSLQIEYIYIYIFQVCVRMRVCVLPCFMIAPPVRSERCVKELLMYVVRIRGRKEGRGGRCKIFHILHVMFLSHELYRTKT